MDPVLADDVSTIARQAESALRAFDGSRVFITGGTGFVGRWFLRGVYAARHALGVDIRPVVLSRDPERFRRLEPELSERVEFVTGDVRTLPAVSGEIDAIVHGAAETNVLQTHPPNYQYHDVSLRGTLAVLELARRTGAKRFLYLSSGAIYGAEAFSAGAAAEDDSHAPSTMHTNASYGNAKRACEALISAFAESCNTAAIAARLFAFVGPNLPLDSGYAIGNFIADALAGGPIRVTGDGTPVRSYLYGSDLSVWLWTLLAAGRSGRAYNVGSDRPVSIAELARLVVDVVGGKSVVIARQGESGLRTGTYVPSTQRITSELGVRESVELVEAIRRTARWWQAGEDKGVTEPNTSVV